MENKLKVGDKVKCLDESYATQFGKVGVIKSFNGNLIYVEAGDTERSYYSDELELVTDDTASVEWDGVFRVGDKGRTRNGDSYEILSVSEERTYNIDTPQPIKAKVADSAPSWHCADGSYLGDEETGLDLMPPTVRGVVDNGKVRQEVTHVALVDNPPDPQAVLATAGVDFAEYRVEVQVKPWPDTVDIDVVTVNTSEGTPERQAITADASYAASVTTIEVPTEEGMVVLTGADVAALMRRVAELESKRDELLKARQVLGQEQYRLGARVAELEAERDVVELPPGMTMTSVDNSIDYAVERVINDLENARSMTLSSYQRLRDFFWQTGFTIVGAGGGGYVKRASGGVGGPIG
ncbi:hypothetical protein [Bradyrhizobium sp. 613_E4_N2_2]|uniref:hypothetical protein n=1 Tax=Bradyrhizobium sp. 613_E4_N2_2 TaxID=3240371 RepID=UPI003F8C223E